jgi:hypothetical protein
MSEKIRNKKDGEDTNKQNQQMREHERTGYIPDAAKSVSDAVRLANTPREGFDDDLRPHEFAGNNDGTHDALDPDRLIRAYDRKEWHEKLPQFTNDELKNLLILPQGTRLEQGASYFDLLHPEDGEFSARADFVTNEENLILPKNQHDFEIWNKLLGKDTANT